MAAKEVARETKDFSVPCLVLNTEKAIKSLEARACT